MSEQTVSKCCGTCHFWKEKEIDFQGSTGQCRAAPPVYEPTPLYDGTPNLEAFPQTHGGVWCGRHIWAMHVLPSQQDDDWYSA